MKNGLIEKTIEEFKNKRLNVYKADPDQIVRDTRVAERATKDHVGRWLFELLQNSDDAGASEVRIIINEATIYVTDNGHGLKPRAVSAICGTDFSDKTTGTIGRKGVGFKSVYEVSRNPQVLTVNGEGIEFSPEKTKKWLRENGLNDGHVPYQWVPFVIPWDNAQTQDPQLGNLKEKNFKTIVRLPGLSQEKKEKAEQLLKEWPPHALFAFRHLRQITAPGLEVILSAGDDVWTLQDSRGKTPAEWRVAKHVEHPPAGVLEVLEPDESERVSADGISFLISAPLENGCVVPTSDYFPIHVFYPTEQKGPVRLLLHAEFLVKSDRTAIIPVDGSPFNEWVADKLAYNICKFVSDSYRPKSPSSHINLLVPHEEIGSHPVAEDLWQRIADKAREDLRLADADGRQLLRATEAKLISVSVHPGLARTLLKATSVRRQLLHPSFDNDKEAHKALRELGCNEIHDQDLMAAIAGNADSLATDTQWVWSCWQWLADWVAEEPYGVEHRQRIESVRSLPVVPVFGSLVKASDLKGRIVTWKPDTGVDNLPDWLPLTFVEDWFRDRLQNEDEYESSIKKLSKVLGIVEPGENAIQRAVGRAIKQYWKNKQGDPGRFLRFILVQDWHETIEVSAELKRCPVPLAQPVDGETWAEAGKAYFGREWGNDLLADLYNGVRGVAWVASGGILIESDHQHRVLEWLGVAKCPRVLEERGPIYVWQLPEDCAEWKKRYLETVQGSGGRSVERIACITRLDHLAVASLDKGRAPLLVRLIANHWESYYADHAEITAEGTRGREQYYRSWPVKARWWWEVCEELSLPTQGQTADHISITTIWVPDKSTNHTVGELLPVLHLEAFENDKEVVREWLISEVGVRTRITQMTIEEWNEMLSRHIPDKAPAERLGLEEGLRDKVTGWYAACLDTVAEQEDISESVFASCPLLCRKGDVWRYVVDEPRYLNDDNDLARAFADDVWLFHIPARLTTYAVKYLGVLLLSNSVEVNVTPGEPQQRLSDELGVRFNESLQYVWAWRSSQSKQAAERLSFRLKSLEVFVVPALKASLSLDGLRHEVEQRWHVNDNSIYLNKDHANDAELALALAKALDVRSEADFYENLLRCNDNHKLKEKLLSKGMPDAEIERCLREYSRRPAEKEYDDGTGKVTNGVQGTSTSQTPSSGDSQGQQLKHPPATQPVETSKETSLGSPESVKNTKSLKDPGKTPYFVGSPPSEGARAGGSSESGGAEREGHFLTNAEKAELEEAGRILAARELERMGYSVEKMPQENPGFDLRAKKDGDELRVEVKAHSGRANVVDVTQREYKEYLGQQGYRWELWNVEHLAEDDPYIVVITPYDQIPDDALDVRTFRVDLKKCQ